MRAAKRRLFIKKLLKLALLSVVFSQGVAFQSIAQSNRPYFSDFAEIVVDKIARATEYSSADVRRYLARSLKGMHKVKIGRALECELLLNPHEGQVFQGLFENADFKASVSRELLLSEGELSELVEQAYKEISARGVKALEKIRFTEPGSSIRIYVKPETKAPIKSENFQETELEVMALTSRFLDLGLSVHGMKIHRANAWSDPVIFVTYEFTLSGHPNKLKRALKDPQVVRLRVPKDLAAEFGILPLSSHK
ncbi:MAG: hypothetical protein AB1540_05525 [Bdellovibrionota bacterium]